MISFSVARKLRRRCNITCALLALGGTVCVHQFACSMSFPVHIYKAGGTTCFVGAACLLDKLPDHNTTYDSFIRVDGDPVSVPILLLHARVLSKTQLLTRKIHPTIKL
jgi:hypothetical protein